MKKKSRTWLLIIMALALSVGLAYALPNKTRTQAVVDVRDDSSIVVQKVVGMYDKPVEVTKVYLDNRLLGVVYDRASLEEAKKKAFSLLYAEDFATSNIRFDDHLYFYEEKTYLQYENADERIGQYMVDNDLFMVEAYRITINDRVIYVKDLEEFKTIFRDYVKSYIDEDSFIKLENDERISDLTTYGEQDVKIYVEETITATKTGASATEILKSSEDIIQFLCYGGEKELEYYTVQKYDTVESVATAHALTAEQLVIINDRISSVNQVLQEGSKVNVTMFTSPITVVVERQRFVREDILQPAVKYVNDSTMEGGTRKVEAEGHDGYRNTLYQDVYVNGVITSYKQVSTKVIEEAQQRVIRVGTKKPEGEVTPIDPGSTEPIYSEELNWCLPVTNPKIICRYGCYKGHNGTDFVDRYQRYGVVHACEAGKIIRNSYTEFGGWSYTIDHGHGFKLRYLHMRKKGWYPEGTYVTRFQAIGDIGMSGNATCPHVHITVYYNNKEINPCSVLPC